MTLPTPDPAAPTYVPAAPPPAAPEPLAAPVPAAPAPKAGKGRRALVTIITVVVVIIVGVGIRLAIQAGADKLATTLDDYTVGKCLDDLPGAAGTTTVPKIVGCSDSKAKAKIVDAFPGRHAADNRLCPASADAYDELSDSSGDTVLLCVQGL